MHNNNSIVAPAMSQRAVTATLQQQCRSALQQQRCSSSAAPTTVPQ